MAFDADDMDAFFDADMPGYQLATIGAASVPCLFRGPYAESLGMVESSNPSILCQSADVTGVTAGTTTLTVNGASYTVISTQPDAPLAQTRLILEEA